MKNENLNEISTDDLKKKEKVTRLITSVFIGMLSLLFVLSIYITIKKGFTPLFVVALALFPVVTLNLKNLKNIRDEIESRKN
jgi:mannose/fructose/N-acetylgalactosamine-specific phosphotransferase system component IID